MTVRRPRAAVTTTALPALGAVLAAGCHDPQCGSTRGDELEAHTPEIQRGGRAGDPAAVLHGIAVAIGLAGHTETTVDEPRATRGEPTAVTTLPRTPVTTRTPVENPDVDGSIHAVTPDPMASPGVPDVPTPHTRPHAQPQHPPIAVPGGIRAVHPAVTVPPAAHPHFNDGMVMGRRAPVRP